LEQGCNGAFQQLLVWILTASRAGGVSYTNQLRVFQAIQILYLQMLMVSTMKVIPELLILLADRLNFHFYL
jgi:hypothetical protein